MGGKFYKDHFSNNKMNPFLSQVHNRNF